VVVWWSGNEHLDREYIGVVRACRRWAHIACTRSIETIRMKNKEEMGVVVEGD
jgi:hypothetical protein